MANTEDGGVIIVGVSEESGSAAGFKRDGVTVDVAATFKVDVMKDQVEGFADPFVEFSVDLITEDVSSDLRGAANRTGTPATPH